jgi:hypothetical protein
MHISQRVGTLLRHAFLGSFFALSLTACYVDERPVAVAPPPTQVVEDPAPRAGYVWIRGYWGWNGNRYVWVQGRWAPARPGYHWVPAHWVDANGSWQLVRGHWDPDAS